MTGSASLVSTEALHEAVSRRLAHQCAWGMSEEEWRILVRELVDRMEERARRQSWWVYSELTKGTPLDSRSGWHYAISSVLAVIADGVHACALPMLAAVVWGKATRAVQGLVSTTQRATWVDSRQPRTISPSG